MSFLQGMGRTANPARTANETRINVSVDKELHRKLKSILALKEKTIRQWVIEQAEATVTGSGPSEPKAGS
jgi:predicted HicB family RNase H-like nuclease